jgi:hypothetical protein
MVKYRFVIFGQYLLIILASAVLLWIFYGMILGDFIENVLGQSADSKLALGISIITITAPIVSIIQGVTSWLRDLRENRIKSELIRVIDAQSKSPKGMDIFALIRESGLPHEILQKRVNELVLLGRLGVKLTPNNNREYYLLK